MLDIKQNIKHMKWWGWGDPQKKLDLSAKPDLWSYIERGSGGAKDIVSTPPVDIAAIQLPEAKINSVFLAELQNILHESQIKFDKEERLVHAYGKSFRDLWRVRHGIVNHAPDAVIYPQNEEEVIAIVHAANRHHVAIIPFGGGSNIAGCLEVIRFENRMYISLDMKYMNQVLSLDAQSGIACIQAGVLGPFLEKQLNQQGFTLGHFPDSFEYSTLGGWVATRSAGMQSDCYGKIEDMVISLRMVTPSGTIVTRTVPKSSNGIDINHMCIGSEGILGVITEVNVKVHKLPEERSYLGYLFPTFDDGIAAIYECVQRDCLPVITRLNDADKTALSFAFKNRSSLSQAMVSKLIKIYLRKMKNFDFAKVCLMLNCFEGTAQKVKQQKKLVNAIFKKNGAVCLGTSPGKSFEKAKYDFPYLRDYVMDRDMLSDVSETSTVWSNIANLYRLTKAEIEQAIRNTGVQAWVGCHISHNYQTGASLYFTFACLQKKGEELSQYLAIKKAAEDAFLKYGGTLSHHHAVGTEHLPWLQEEISAAGILAIKSLKQGMDPQNIMNPGKLIPSNEPFKEWENLGESRGVDVNANYV